MIYFQKSKPVNKRVLLSPQQMAAVLDIALAQENEIDELLEKAGSLKELETTIQ